MKTTKKQFDLFVKKVHGFIETFGLKSWDIDFEFGNTEPAEQASCTFHLSSRSCAFNFSKTCKSKMPDRKISRIAFHEVCELFFAEFRVHMDRNPESIDQIIHEKIRTLENVVYDDEDDK